MTSPGSRNHALSLVRGWLHDRTCMSSRDVCSGDNGHARRCQHTHARALVDCHRSGGDIAPLLHDVSCYGEVLYGGCGNRAEHIERYRSDAAALVEKLGGQPAPEAS
jgi:hypothetical protein